MSKYIQLNKNKKAIVDDEDFAKLNQYRWYVISKGNYLYVRKSDYHKGVRKVTYLHHLILPPKKGYEIDHINHNALDNRRCNLRYCTKSQNQQNMRVRKNCLSKHKGVTWDRARQKYKASIYAYGQNHNIGRFDDENIAAIAYKNKAIELFGDYAYTELV